MQIGLIGGIGPAATDFYYRQLIRRFAQRSAPLELTIVHADTPSLLENLAKNQTNAQADIFARLTKRLAAAGAEFVAVTSIAGHFSRKEFESRSVLPVVDMIDAIDQAIARRGLKRIGILGTHKVMESRLYGGVTTATVIPPSDTEIHAVHDAYVSMAASGTVTDVQRAVFYAAAHRLIDEQNVDAIMLGGTDLALVFDKETAPFPIVDCASIHVDVIAEKALRCAATRD